MNKWKDIISDGIGFLLKNKRYPAAFVLVVITVLFLTSSDNQKVRLFPEFKKKVQEKVKTDAIPKIETHLEEEDLNPNPLILNEDKELNEFIKNYYKSLEAGDVDKIREYTDVLNDVEVNSIKQKAKAREAHKNIKVYTKKGPEEDSYLAYVYLDLKFKNIKTTAPGIEPFYIKKESDGYVIINSMNSSAEDLQYTNDMEASEDVVELFSKTDEAYREACAKDKELVRMLKENGFNVPDISKEDKKETEEETTADTKSPSEAASNTTTDTVTSSQTAEGTASEKPKKKETPAASETTNSDANLVGKTYVLTDGMRLREKKSTESGVVASAIKDDTVKVLTIYDNSSWIKVELYSNRQTFTGYMKKDVLLTNAKIKN